MSVKKMEDGRIFRTHNDKFKDGMVWCNGCQQWLLPKEFNRSSHNSYGLASKCKKCMKGIKRPAPDDVLHSKGMLSDEDIAQVVRDRVKALGERKEILMREIEAIDKKLNLFRASATWIRLGPISGTREGED